MRVLLAILAPILALGQQLPSPVVSCTKYLKDTAVPECRGRGAGCVTTDGWFSKDNISNPNQRVNAQQICIQQGYKGASTSNYGGNWGHQCRHPGNAKSVHNRAGGSLTALGYTVAWQCTGGNTGPLPTMPPTKGMTAPPTPTGKLPYTVKGYEPVTDCNAYAIHYKEYPQGKECHNKGAGCVAEGWFSKENVQNPNQRVNAQAICKDAGFTGASPTEYGGNWGDECRYPGSTRNMPNRAGGSITALGYTVSWMCTGSRGNPIMSPTPEPTFDGAHDEGYPPLPQHVVDCGNYHKILEEGEEKECLGVGKWCVGDHWYSKDSLNHRVDAEQICKDQGYKGIDPHHYGGNWGHQCRYPGTTLGNPVEDDGHTPNNNGKPNKAGGNVNALGYTVTWKCMMPRRAYDDTFRPSSAPTPRPTKKGEVKIIKVPEPVVYCGDGHYADETDQECFGKGSGCVGEHWFSKDNVSNPNQRVNAQQICKDNGYSGADPQHYGGNWGHQCRFPGTGNTPNKAGGSLTNLGYTVSWRCMFGGAPSKPPTARPGTVVDCGEYAKQGNARECMNKSSPCVGKGWFSKDNVQGVDVRVNANQICKDNGYARASPVNFGGNWGHQCRYPGLGGRPNKAGGSLDAFGYTVTWQCIDDGGTQFPTFLPTAPTTRPPTPAPGPLVDQIGKLIVNCGKYDGEECKGKGLGCVGEGWYSKDNLQNPYQRVNAQAVCELEGYENVGEYGGNWGHQCRFPGTTKGVPNKAGGAVTNLGYTVAWQCVGKKTDACAEITKKRDCVDKCIWDDEDGCMTKPPSKCDDVDKLNKSLHAVLCKNAGKEGEDKCTMNQCKYKAPKKEGKKGKCKAQKENKIKCSKIDMEVCCTFPGCDTDGKKCTGTFAGW